MTNETICPRCQSGKLKTWRELSEDEKILVEKLPLSADFSLAKRKKHRFCKRCWFEEIDSKTQA